MIIDFKKTHPDAKLPERKHGNSGVAGTGDTGYDIFAVESKTIQPGSSGIISTGIQLANIAPGYWFRIEARSGLGFKHSVFPHAGIIDNCYRGDLAVKLYNFGTSPYTVCAGDRIAQMVIYPVIEADMRWTDIIDETLRGENRLGSTGK